MAVEAFAMQSPASAFSRGFAPAGAAASGASLSPQAIVAPQVMNNATGQAANMADSSLKGAALAGVACVVGAGVGAAKSRRRLRRQQRHALEQPGVMTTPRPLVDHRLRRPRTSSLEEPICASILSTRSSWRNAVHEIVQEAKCTTARRSHKQWDFGVAFVHGHDDVSVAQIANKLDTGLGTEGSLLVVAVDGCSGDLVNQSRGSAHKCSPGISLCGVQLPQASGPPAPPLCSMHQGNADLTEATPFFIGKQELMEISSLVMQYQATAAHGHSGASNNVRAWRRYLGVPEHADIGGILLFQDPLASNYVKKQVAAGLDLAFPDAVKAGGVASDLIPSRFRMALATSAQTRRQFAAQPEDAGIAGIILPSKMSLHTVVTPGAVRVGPEMRISEADQHVISKINEEPAREFLTAATAELSDIEQMLVDRSGLLIGLETPAEIKEVSGGDEKPTTRSELTKMALPKDWVVRSYEDMLSGDSIILRRENLKRVPPRVGPQYLRMQLHVQDCTWAQQEEKTNFQRYMGARMFSSQDNGTPFGALALTCTHWAKRAAAIGEAEVGLRAIKEVLGELPVAGASVSGELAPAGISMGGVDNTRTAQHGYSSAACIFSYEP
eukprot:TRINITY_DN16846_c0_g1_i1.p1 TRINITY_DN16846_c0_g1~~TRINITY_DN16846_c0_g1_i1.p1  ORF type:complete len:612 (+),score=125.92 TRINITY_DN16846_c0_g1_i1:71-1906(+)